MKPKNRTTGTLRKKSPRAPSIGLDDALARAQAIYEQERRHAASIDVVSQAIGYKSANNGAAMAAIASLRYYGLLERPQEGLVAVTKEVEDYLHPPSADVQAQLLRKWIRMPSLFADLPDKYASGLPSGKMLRHELIQKGFNPAAADSALTAFIRSVEYVKYFDDTQAESAGVAGVGTDASIPSQPVASSASATDRMAASPPAEGQGEPAVLASFSARHDRIAVRLPGGRRVWLEIPAPFYATDKLRLKGQIDLLLTEDEEGWVRQAHDPGGRGSLVSRRSRRRTARRRPARQFALHRCSSSVHRRWRYG